MANELKSKLRLEIYTAIAAFPNLLEIMNEADGISDIEGKAAMGSGE